MIVFLDIDGVLNSDADGDTYDCVIYPEKVAILNRIPAMLPDVLFVVSSSWRNIDDYYGPDDPRKELIDVRLLLKKRGFRGKFHEDWRTPWANIKWDSSSGRAGWLRGDEVLTWLADNGLQDAKHAILDDMPDFHEGQPVVLTDAKIGLTDADVDKAIAILMK
jgi:hypothetical protein